jgi:hypothetical protein
VGAGVGVIALISVMITVCILTTAVDKDAVKSPAEVVEAALKAMPIIDG